MKALPRYTFRKGDLCPHGDPDCLCDVKIVCPIAIRTDIRHPYWEMALEELDDWSVTERNFVEASSIMLGLAEVARSAQHNVMPDNRGPECWRNLPEQVRTNLVWHYRAGSPWQYALLELDGVDCELEQVRRYYLERRRTAQFHRDSTRAARNKERRKSARMRSAPSEIACLVCGTVVPNTQGKRRTCGVTCRIKLSRANKEAGREG